MGTICAHLQQPTRLRDALGRRRPYTTLCTGTDPLRPAVEAALVSPVAPAIDADAGPDPRSQEKP